MATIIPTALVTRKPDLIAADIDGDIVMMGIEQGEYYGITGVGSRVWELLATPTSIESMAQVISKEYETDEAMCQADLHAFIEDMIKLDLVSVLSET